jgi:CheY-like chemotaxis protein
MVVEDQALIALALAADLVALGCEVVGRVASGEEAVELAQRHAPEIVLMDVHLAGAMGGVEAAARIQQGCAASIIFVTAYADGAERAHMEALRPAGILCKPYDPEALAQLLRVDAARRWAQRHALPAAAD